MNVSSEPTDPAVSFHGIEDGDEPRVMELIHAAFDESWPGLPLNGEPIDYLRWKIRSPLADSTYSTAMKVDGRFVGLTVGVAREGVLRGKKYRVSAGGGDTCVHPDYQGRGLYRALTEETNSRSRQRFRFAVGNSTHPTVLRSRESRGVHSIVHPFDRMLKPLAHWRSFGATDAGHLRRVALGVRFGARRVSARLRWRPYGDPVSIALRQIDEFDERMDRFSEVAASQFELMLTRDADFLNWRYRDPRGGDFRASLAEDQGAVLGYSVLRVRGDRCYLVDLLALPERPDVVRALVEDAVAYAERAQMPALVCLLPRHHPYMTVLQRLGFVRSGTNMSRAYWPWDMPAELAFLESDARSRIHLMEGDGDMA